MTPTSPEQPSSLWRNRSFVLLFSAQVISLLGSGATTIGLALLAYEMAGASSATAVLGNALTLRILAFLLFSQPAGILADRVPRKTILIAADVLRAVLLACLPLVTAVWHVYLLIFFINAVTAFFTPTYEATVPSVVGEVHIVKALSFSRVAVDIEAVAAPAVAGLIVATVGPRSIFWFDAGTYLVSALLVIAATIPQAALLKTAVSMRTLAAEVTYGTRVILREPSLRQAIVLSFVEALAGAVAIVATVTYVREVLQRGEADVTIAMAAIGLGSTVTALVLGRLTGRYEMGITEKAKLHGRRHAWGRAALLAGGYGLGLVLLPGLLLPSLCVLAILWALNGAGQALIAIPSATLLAEHTFEAERGRVYAAHFALTHACWLITYPAVGHAAARWGAPATLTGSGVACLLVAFAASLIGRPSAAHIHEPGLP